MNETAESLAELQARNAKLEKDILALQAKDDAVSKADLRAAQAELREIKAQISLASALEKTTALEAAESKRKEDGAEAAVQAMVSSGEIPVRDTELQATYKAKFIADPTLIPLMASKGLAGGGLQTGRVGKGADEGNQLALGYGNVHEGANRVNKAMAALVAKQMKIVGFGPVEREQRNQLALEASLIWSKEIRGPANASGMLTMKPEFINSPLEAATDQTTLGTLVGTYVLQRWLDVFRFKFPLISRIMTDFSAEPSDLGQVVNTRIILIPAVQSFDNTLDTDNRPKGWATASNGQTTDVNITLDELVGVPMPFSVATLSSTRRNLFGEQAEAQVYALVKYYIAKIFAICTAANYNAYAAVTAADAQGIVRVPTAYATYGIGLIDFGRTSVAGIGAAFDANEVPDENRSLLLNAAYYAKGTVDPSLVTFFAGQQSPGIVTEGKLPNLNGFDLIKAPWFPATNNRVGFALQKNALLAKSRLPNNILQVFPGAGNGSWAQVTDAETGFSLAMIEYVNNTRGFAERIACAILGAAKADARGGLVITSA